MSLLPSVSTTATTLINSIIVLVNDSQVRLGDPDYGNKTTTTTTTTTTSLQHLPHHDKSAYASQSVTHGVSQGKIIAVSIMITLFSIFGCLGNGLVLYVFSKKSDKFTSTIFILALAWTDFFICLVFMPFTMANVLLDSRLHFDFFCKLYQFLNTSNVPLSAFIMVAIAVDRYFSICHPFKHVVTPRRARIALLCLVIVASVLGTITACLYRVHKWSNSTETSSTTTTQETWPGHKNWAINLPTSSSSWGLNTSLQEQILFVGSTPDYTDILGQAVLNKSLGSSRVLTGTSENEDLPPDAVNTEGLCITTFDILSTSFIHVYQKIYMSLFGISLVAVLVLYFFIYTTVTKRRAWRRKQKSWTHSPMTMTDAMTEADDLNKGDDIYTGEGDNLELSPQNNSSMSQSNSKESGSGDSTEGRVDSGTSLAKSTTVPSLRRTCSHENGIERSVLSPSAEKKTNRERRDFNFLANIRTALMLFVVTLVFMVSFLPAWLMALMVMPYEITVFYAHFIYNVANPVIYAFMNQSFRKELKRVFQRGTHLFRKG